MLLILRFIPAEIVWLTCAIALYCAVVKLWDVAMWDILALGFR